jgi:hypothetical protein
MVMAPAVGVKTSAVSVHTLNSKPGLHTTGATQHPAHQHAAQILDLGNGAALTVVEEASCPLASRAADHCTTADALCHSIIAQARTVGQVLPVGDRDARRVPRKPAQARCGPPRP